MSDEFEPRRGQKDATYTYTTTEGNVRTLTPDDEGVLWPKNDEDERALNELGLPVARKAIETTKDNKEK